MLGLAGCGLGGGDDEINLSLDDSEVRIVGDFSEREGHPPELVMIAVSEQGDVFLRDYDGVSRPTSASELETFEPRIDEIAGGMAVYGDRLLVVHGDSVAPHRGVMRYRLDGGAHTMLDLPLERGQILGDVALDAEGDMFLTVLAAEETSAGVQVLRVVQRENHNDVEPIAGQGRGCTTAEAAAQDAQFQRLAAIAVDDEGDVYVADESCFAVYRIADGTVSPILMDGTAGLSGTRSVDLAVTSDYLYVADRMSGGELSRSDEDDGRVLRFDLRTEEVSVVLDDAGEDDEDIDDGRINFRDVRGLAVTPDGDLLVLDDDRLIGVGL